MKKLLVMATVAMMAAVSVNAQVEYPKNEIGVSYGYLSNSQWIDAFGTIFSSLLGARYDEDSEKFIGPVSIQYFHHVKDWIAVGAVGVYGHSSKDILSGSDVIGSGKNTYLTIMPAVKFDWFRRESVSMYSKLALGATYRSEKVEYNNRSTGGSETPRDNRSNSEFHFNWQATVFGIEAGSPMVRGFLETGFGEQGIACVGVRFKF